jgi:hypothetical protein
VGLCITVSAWLLQKNKRGILAGFLLALATSKPQVAFWPVVFLLFISINRKRYRFLWGFLGAMAVFFLLSFFLLPTWIRELAQEVMRYPSYNPPYTPAAILRSELGNIGLWIGWGISILALSGLALLLRKSQNLKRENGLMMLVGLVMTLSFLSGIPNDPGNEAILILPIAGIFLGKWAGSRQMEIIQWGIFLLLIWIGLWAFFLTTIHWTGQPVQTSMILFPLLIFLLAGWYLQEKFSHPAVGKAS